MRRFILYSAAALVLSAALLAVNTRAGRHAVGYLLGDYLAVCTCGSGDVTFRPAQGPLDSVHRHYTATCTRCGEQWEVVDVAWDDPRKVIDVVFEAAVQEPDDPLEE